MTDRIDHRAAAERMLADADEWTAQAGELSPEASELSCLAYAAVHALLAIHDTLNAKPCDCAKHDAYAAREAEQREAAEPDPLDESDHRDRVDAGGTRWTRAADECWANGAHHVLELISLPGPLTFAPEAECSRCGEIYPGTAEATMEHHRACTGETPENPMGDPLDEDDHRDRLDRNGWRWTHRAHLWCQDSCTCYEGSWKLDQIDDRFGPLTFAPDADGAPSVTAPAADDPVGDAVDGEGDERRYLNAQASHERARLTAQLRQVISSVQDSGDLAELDALADAWEAGTNG